MIELTHEGIYYKWADRNWVTSDNKKVARSFGMQLNKLYVKDLVVENKQKRELMHYAFDMEKQKHYDVAEVIYMKMLKIAERELIIKEMDSLLYRLCTMKYRLMKHEEAIALFKQYSRNKNLKEYRSQMRVLYTDEYKEIEAKYEDLEPASVFSKIFHKKKPMKDIRITCWGGYTFHQKVGEVHMVMNYGKQYRYIKFDNIKNRTSANQVLLFGYAYIVSLLDEPCNLIFISNTPAGVTGMFDIRHERRPLKKKICNYKEKLDVQQRIFEGKHVLKKEIVAPDSLAKIKQMVEFRKLQNTVNIAVYNQVAKKHIR